AAQCHSTLLSVKADAGTRYVSALFSDSITQASRELADVAAAVTSGFKVVRDGAKEADTVDSLQTLESLETQTVDALNAASLRLSHLAKCHASMLDFVCERLGKRDTVGEGEGESPASTVQGETEIQFGTPVGERESGVVSEGAESVSQVPQASVTPTVGPTATPEANAMTLTPRGSALPTH
ncbi:hypothetical protein KIPB_006525, partial [Kipferlia bialata]